MTQCPYCGETSFYPSGPHSVRPCPFREREHRARMKILEAELAAITAAAQRDLIDVKA